MSDNARFRELVETVDFTMAEQRHFRARGAHLVITHLYHATGTKCASGELVGNIALGGMAEPLSFGLSPKAMLITDCLCRYRMPLTAQRIEHILNSDPFYANQGANGNDGVPLAFWFDQRTIRVYVERIQERMVAVFQQAGLPIEPHHILKSTFTESNMTAYSLNATVECVHIDL